MGGEVTDDVGGVTTPEGEHTLFTVSTRESVTDALVGSSKTTLLDLSRDVSALAVSYDGIDRPSHPGSEPGA